MIGASHNIQFVTFVNITYIITIESKENVTWNERPFKNKSDINIFDLPPTEIGLNGAVSRILMSYQGVYSGYYHYF